MSVTVKVSKYARRENDGVVDTVEFALTNDLAIIIDVGCGQNRPAAKTRIEQRCETRNLMRGGIGDES